MLISTEWWLFTLPCTKDKVYPKTSKLKGIQSYPHPSDQKEYKSVIGLTEIYRKKPPIPGQNKTDTPFNFNLDYINL